MGGSSPTRNLLLILATGLSAAGACTKPVAHPRRPVTNDIGRTRVDCEIPPPAFPESSEPCVAGDDPRGNERASCVPERSRGPRIASDGALGIRVYRACESRQLDRRRIMLERTGTELASREALAGVLHRLERSPQIFPMGTAQILSSYYGQCPETGGPDPDGRPESCLEVNLTSNEVDLPAVMRAFAELFEDTPDVCIRVVVAFGAVDCSAPD